MLYSLKLCGINVFIKRTLNSKQSCICFKLARAPSYHRIIPKFTSRTTRKARDFQHTPDGLKIPTNNLADVVALGKELCQWAVDHICYRNGSEACQFGNMSPFMAKEERLRLRGSTCNWSTDEKKQLIHSCCLLAKK